MLFCFLFLYAPIVVLVAFSFNDSRLAANWQGFTFKWYVEVFNSRSVMTAFQKQPDRGLGRHRHFDYPGHDDRVGAGTVPLPLPPHL
jgi:hypothetical protein